MLSRITKAFLVALLLIAAARVSMAQTSSPTGKNYFGFDLGATGTSYFGGSNFFYHMNDTTGSISTYAPFSKLGTGVGLVVGGKLGLRLSDNFDFEAKLKYFSNYSSSSETDSLFLEPSTTFYNVQASHTYSLLLTNVGLSALIHAKLSDMIYGIGGVEASELLGNSIGLTQQLDPNGPHYPDQSTGFESNTRQLTRDPASVTDYFATSRVGLDLGVGAATGLGSSSTMVDAELLLSFPVTAWLTANEQTKLNSYATTYNHPAPSFPSLFYASFTIGIRFPFGANSGSDVIDYRASQTTTTGTATTSQETPDAEGKVPLTGRVTNSRNGDPVDATMTVVDLTTNEVVATDHTDRNGYYKVRVKAPGKYSVTADADGYLFGSSYFDVDENGRILATHKDIKLSEATTGRTRLLVFFDFNKADLKSASIPELNRAVHLMKAVPSMQVEIAGYTDNVGTADYNKDLSLRRAVAVKDYLVAHGVPKARVSAAGYGADSPIADNSAEDGRAENRRVEFVVTSK